MPRRLLLAAIVIATGPWLSAAVDARAARVDPRRLIDVVTALAAPAMQGREAGTPGNLAARAYVRNAFAAIGLEPAIGGRYEQPFRFTSRGQWFVRRGSSVRAIDNAANLIGLVRGTGRTSRTLVVSAHYDHLGVRNGVVYPGADDNASGIAALLECARYIHDHPLAHPVLFAAFDAEEEGLEGAKAFMRAPPVAPKDLAIDINFDMVSRNDRHEIFAAGTYHEPWLRPIIDDVQRRTPVTIRYGHDRPPRLGGGLEDWTPQSDHAVFHDHHVPFIYFGVEDHPDYHKPTDTANKIDPVFFDQVAEMLLDAVVAIDRAI
jgi:Zn-dependent M28 family amino/carboxypeptidase